MSCRYLIDEPCVTSDTSSDSFLQTRVTLIEPILRLALPSTRHETLKATASVLRGSIYIWLHEAFSYQGDFAILFQSLFGATCSELDLFLYPMIMYRSDLCRVWLDTRRIHELGPCFRLRWQEESALNPGGMFDEFGLAVQNDIQSVEPMEDPNAVFLDTMYSLTSLIRLHVYLSAQESTQFPAVEVESLNVVQLTGILREVSARA